MKKILRIITIPYYNRLWKDIPNNKNILDLGCGYNSPLFLIPKKYKKVTGIEKCKTHFIKAREIGNYDVLFNIGIKEYCKEYIRSYDCILLSDVIEHIKKDEGIEIIEMLKSRSKRIIIFTPLGFTIQQNMDGNKYNKHLSGWYSPELEKLGFKTKIIQNYTEKALYGVWKND